MTRDSEIMRLRYKYRKLILEGKLKLPYKDAIKLIGPDSAYKLYFSLGSRQKDDDRGKK